MKYLSTFTGIGGFEIAIHKIFPKAQCIGFAEIDPYAIKTYLKNYPEHAHLNIGNLEALVFDYDPIKKTYKVNEDRVKKLPNFDLLIGGSPCQDLSIAKKNREHLAGSKSKLFFAFLEILRIKKPKYFILENVASMSVQSKNQITQELINAGYDTTPIMINSALVSAQKRKRLYWTNWHIEQPSDMNVTMNNLIAWSKSTRYPKDGPSYVEDRETNNGKANTLTTGSGCGAFSSKNYIVENGVKRLLTPNECETLQTFPQNWTEGVSSNQRYRQLGNAVNVKTIEHILLELKKTL